MHVEKKRAAAAFIYFSPCCSGTPNMPMENGKLPQTHRGKNMDIVDGALSGSSCQSLVDPTVHPPLSMLYGLP